MTAGRKIPEEKRERIKKVILNDPELSNPILAKRFGVSKIAIYYIRKELKEEQKNG